MTCNQATILLEIATERGRQTIKWGEQNHLSVPEGRRGHGDRIMSPCEALLLPSEALGKERCDSNAKNNSLTWGHIAVEELCEAVSAQDDNYRRGELVQLAAVIVAWIECIDRKNSPVHYFEGTEDEPQGWYFWDETQSARLGPYISQAAAETQMKKYARCL